MNNDLLFELGTEELPIASVKLLSEALKNLFELSLQKANLGFARVTSFATPRRLAVRIEAVDAFQASQKISRKGPLFAESDSIEPSRALQGFANSCGVAIKELSLIQTEKGQYWHYDTMKEGISTKQLLPQMIRDVLKDLPISKPMRWGAGLYEFIRPVHWAVLLFGEEIVDCELFGVRTSDHSYGHRFHAPEAVKVTAKDYENILEKAYVVADFESRKNHIKQQVEALAIGKKFKVNISEGLLETVTSIVEWPQALLGHFSNDFLKIPPEVIIATLQHHQKCFSLTDEKGALVPYFITVANINSSNPKQVIAGNEKVVHARLSDAAFFYHQDQKQPLVQKYDETAKVVFQAKLGTLQEKTQRVQRLMEYLSEFLSLDTKEATRVALLSKCDLMTGMVGEFPELQGLMGYYYALNDLESKTVATALDEQYMPRFAKDRLPSTPLGLALSLADRIDTLVGNFAIGQKPTGEKDPFKLRRHALAVVRLLMGIPTKLELSDLLRSSLETYQQTLNVDQGMINDLKCFILERLPAFYSSQGISNEFILAVNTQQNEWLFDMDKRIMALISFSKISESDSLTAACRRVNNLLNQQTASTQEQAVDETLFKESAEIALYKAVEVCEKEVMLLYQQNKYEQILKHLATLKEPIDRFFDSVMVMVDDVHLKENRLRLLRRLQKLFQGVADISFL